MALRWDFKEDLIGRIEYRGTDVARKIYDGNAFAIFLNEWEENGQSLYSLACFYADKEHAKRCLGLTKETKGDAPVFPDDIWVNERRYEMGRVVLLSSNRQARDLGQLLMKAYKNITITMTEEV